MNYLPDKKDRKKKFINIVYLIIALSVLFYFRSGIYNGFAYASQQIFRPVLIFGNALSAKFSGVNGYFASKNSLNQENENLKAKLAEDSASITNYNSLLSQNLDLKEILGRKNEKTTMTLSAILGKPNQSPYDTLIIDAGIAEKVSEGDIVFALGNVPVGRVAAVYPNSSKVVLFSNWGEKTQVMVSVGVPLSGDVVTTPPANTERSVFMEVVGRGGGNFEMILPRDFTPAKGDEVVLPGITPYVVGIVETVISDPRDPFVKALLTSPVNVQELKFVEVSAK